MKQMLYGDGQEDPKKEIIDKLCEAVFANDLLLPMLRSIKKFEFEVRAHVGLMR